MKTFLAKYEIFDGEHEYTAYGLIKAKDLDEAIKFAESQEHTADWIKEGQEPTYFDYSDGMTASRCKDVVELTQNQINVIGELGLAYYMN